MATIIYLHGFRSTGTSKKSQALKQTFSKEHVFSPDLPNDPDEVKELIHTIVSGTTDYPILFVGTSLGGFYANYFAQKYDCPGILINPATVPSKTLYQKIGVNKNHISGELSHWTLEHLEKLAKMEKEVSTIHSGGLVNLFVAKDDDVIDSAETLKNYPYTMHSSIHDTGGHRFEQHWPEVIDRIKQILA